MKEMPSTNTDHPTSSDAPQTPPIGFKSLLACWTKLSNDWMLSFASGLAFNLIVALIPGEGIPATTDNLSGIVKDHSGQPPATEKEKL